jgi:hypothetical protein
MVKITEVTSSEQIVEIGTTFSTVKLIWVNEDSRPKGSAGVITQ